MAKNNDIQFWQGLEADRLAQTPAAGEPLWTTDTQKLYIGDGATAGGILAGEKDLDDYKLVVTAALALKTDTTTTATNTGNIATNTGNIATNASDIVAHTTRIDTNQNAIAANTTNIATNTTDIATNVAAIKTNTDELATKGVANGLAPLGADIKVPDVNLPDYKDEIHTVANNAAMLALTAKQGDICIVSGTHSVYKHNGGVTTAAATWEEMSAKPTVTTVSGTDSTVGVLSILAPKKGDIAVDKANMTTYMNVTGNQGDLTLDWQELFVFTTTIDYTAVTNKVYTGGGPTVTGGTIENDVNTKDWTGHPYAQGKNLYMNSNHVITFTNDGKTAYKWIGNKPVLVGADSTATYLDPVTGVTHSHTTASAADFLLLGTTANDDTTHEVATETAMLAISAKQGDVCVRTDLPAVYKNKSGGNGAITDWEELVNLAPVNTDINTRALKTEIYTKTEMDAIIGRIQASILDHSGWGG